MADGIGQRLVNTAAGPPYAVINVASAMREILSGEIESLLSTEGLSALEGATKIRNTHGYALSNYGWRFIGNMAHADATKEALSLIASQSFRQGVRDAISILEELAPDATVLGGQSAQSLVASVPATPSLSGAIKALKRGEDISNAVTIAMRSALQPTTSSFLGPAVNLAISLATAEDGSVNDRLARSLAGSMGTLLTAAVIVRANGGHFGSVASSRRCHRRRSCPHRR